MVEIIYMPLNQAMMHMRVPFVTGLRVGDALAQSGLLHAHPEIKGLSFGIFSHPVTWDTVLSAGDRVEVYRPLLLDPKEIRRRRAR